MADERCKTCIQWADSTGDGVIGDCRVEMEMKYGEQKCDTGCYRAKDNADAAPRGEK